MPIRRFMAVAQLMPKFTDADSEDTQLNLVKEQTCRAQPSSVDVKHEQL